MEGKKTSFILHSMARGLVALALIALLVIAVYVAKSGTLFTESGDGDARAETPSPAELPQNAEKKEGIVKLDADDQERGGIEAVPPKEIQYQQQVRTYGSIVSLDRLTALYNEALVAEAQLKTAQIKLEASRTASARAQNLLKVFPTSASQAEAAEATRSMDSANVDAAKTAIDVINNTAVQEWGPVLGPAIVLHSDIAEKLVHRTLSLVQLTLEPGATAEPAAHVEISFANGGSGDAELLSPATQTDPKITGASYLYVMPATPDTLAGSAVTAWFAQGNAKASILIPPSAIVWQAGRPWFYVKAAPDRFERNAIGDDAAPFSDGGYVLTMGSDPDQKPVVVAGAQALLSEESRSQVRSDDDD